MPQSPDSSRAGDLLNGVYELHEALAAGVDHDTYRATDTRRGSSVQITLLKAELALRAGAVERFLELPRALAALRHPHVAQTLGIEHDETGIPFVVQEDVKGEPLAKTLAGFAQGMPLGVAVAVLSPVIDAVAAAHALGLVHGRLGREQIQLVAAGGSSMAKLTGFGRAPEGADATSDVWALGSLLYEALSGQSAGRPGKPRTPLDELAPHIPAELAGLIESCLERDPSARPSDAAAVRDSLAKITGSMRGGERKPEPVKPASKPAATPVAPKPASKPTASKPASKPATAKPAAKTASDPAPRKLRAGEENTEPVAPQPSRISAVAATMPDATPFGLGATMAAPVSVAALQQAIEEARERSEPPEPGFELAEGSEDDDDPELSIEMPASSEPPKTVGVRRSKRPQAGQAGGVKNASDLAAAFAPMEGADNVGQTETAESALVRGFKQSFEEQQAAAKSKRRGAAIAVPAAAEAKAKAVSEDKAAASGALKSRKDLREGTKVPSRGITDEQMRHIRSVSGEDKKDDDSVVGILLFLLFLLLLPFATPTLIDPAAAPLPEILWGKEKIAAGSFAVLTTIALVRTWSLQIRAAPALLRPVTTTLKVVTAAVWVLAAGFFLPAGALGPAQRAAAMGLPWGAGGFYLFLALYGLTKAVREASQGALRAVGMSVLYMGAFFGSYRVIATTVMVDAKHRAAMRGKLAAEVTGPDKTGLGGMLGAAKIDLPDAGFAADEPMQERKEVGASEADDMAAIEQLGKSKQQKGKQMDDLHKKLGTLMK